MFSDFTRNIIYFFFQLVVKVYAIAVEFVFFYRKRYHSNHMLKTALEILVGRIYFGRTIGLLRIIYLQI